MNLRIPYFRTTLVLTVGLLSISERLPWRPQASRAADGPGRAGEAPAAEADLKADGPIPAKLIVISGEVDGPTDSMVRDVARKLQTEAVRAGRDAVLVLEIGRGTSRFGFVRETAEFLASPEIARVRTVAWVPGPLDGYNAILALACRDVVMKSTATIGDVGLGQALSETEQRSVQDLVATRVNPRVSAGLATAMMDPQAGIVKVSIKESGRDAAETRIVTLAELARLADEKAEIGDRQSIKDPGALGVFTGTQARELGFLVARTAESRDELAEHYSLPSESLRESRPAGESAVRMIRLSGGIDPVMETFIERQIVRAIESGATTIIFEIDTQGGDLKSCERLARTILSIDAGRVRTVAWAPKGATGGAALAALACDEIFLTETALLGDIIQDRQEAGEDTPFRKPELAIALVTPILDDISRQKERSPALVLAMIDKNLAVFQATHAANGNRAWMTEDEIHKAGNEWIKGDVVPESKSGLALTVGGRRAHELGLAERPVRDFDELRKRLSIPQGVAVKAIGPTWLDDLVFRLNTPGWMFTLIVVGIVCLYLDLHLMTGVLGIVSALCFALFFWSKYLGGTAGWLEVTLFALGIACMAMEIFVVPGFGVFGVSGGLMILASLIMASQTFGNIESGADAEAMSRTIGTLSAAIVSVVVIALLMGRYLPQMPFLSQMFLTPPGFEGRSEEPRLNPWIDPDAGGAPGRGSAPAVGSSGVAMSVLRPAGKAQIGGNYVDVVSEGAFIDAGAAVEVVRIEGNRVVVRTVG